MKMSNLIAYPAAMFDMLPLYHWQHTTTRKNKKTGEDKVYQDGKRPIHAAWMKRTYKRNDVLQRAKEDRGNVGIKLRPDQIVVDVDTRANGLEGLEKLLTELDLKKEFARAPMVRTGGGGYHFYFKKPPYAVFDTLEGVEGVEFKSFGRQVVAAGSKHPSGKHYVWDKDEGRAQIEDLKELPMIPATLFKMIRKVAKTQEQVEGGVYDQEQIANILAKIDPQEFDGNDKWLELMMSIHHASAGAARYEWIEWSTSDPNYADDGEIIGRRWDSLDRTKGDGVTYKTLNMILRKRGLHDMQAYNATPDNEFDNDDLDDQFKPDKVNDPKAFDATPKKKPKKKSKDEAPDNMFEEDDPDDDGQGSQINNPFGWSDMAMDSLENMNRRYIAVVEGGKFRIMHNVQDPTTKRKHWHRLNVFDFKALHSNQRLERDIKVQKLPKNSPTTVALGEAWVTSPLRRTVDGVTFDPSGKQIPGWLNLYEGFAYKPSPNGSWEYLNKVIKNALCAGNPQLYDYVINWLAYLFQYPDRRAEVALVFKGGQGVGKSTLGNVVAKVIGQHALATQSSEHITGRFNSHLRDLLFLFADEAVKPWDKQGESKLKGLITEEKLPIEQKGQDVVQGHNYIHIIMASNDDWVIPAGVEERRFVVSDVSDVYANKKEFWPKLHKELNNGGYERFLWDMLEHPIPEGWHPRHILSTDALIDQKLRSLPPLAQWFYNHLISGQPTFFLLKDHDDWSKPIRFFIEDMRVEFSVFCRNANIPPAAMGRGNVNFLLRELRKILGADNIKERRDSVSALEDSDAIPAKVDGKAPSIEIPNINQCRKLFERMVGGKLDWRETEALDFEAASE